MKAPDIPVDEVHRMAALRSTGALFSPSEERFDRITRLTSQLLGVPMAVISLVADQTQWHKSFTGPVTAEIPRRISFCAHAILSSKAFVVEDARLDPRFADNPLVTGEPFIRFYAGYPLEMPDGSRVGTLCVMDTQPRKLTRQQLQGLRDLAAIAESELQRGQLNASQRELIRERDELKLKASVDGLTRVWNRSAITELVAAEIARAKRGAPLCVAMVDVDHFKKVNDTYGHRTGDIVLVELAARIRRAAREFDAVGRYGGEEFIIVLSNCNLETAKAVCERIRRFVEDDPFAAPTGELRVTVSIGLAALDAEHADLESLVGVADAALYKAKGNGRNQIAY
ncbi:sensor domain-containing diguanylate cyclase [Rhodoferax sp. GW822-FHT02A01]|uniref:sensor domain-containing diguanylate cyclase n=1 Tax=Rhodoferax sp. GW822-FHT02A01 TaxID=3141537 RepID=UPI00315D5768